MGNKKSEIAFWKLVFNMDIYGNGTRWKIYARAQNLRVANKVIFVNHPIDNEKYPDFFYIKGFENQIGTGQLSAFMNLKGERYYDQFVYVKWINNG